MAISAFVDHSLRADEPSCFGQQDSNSVQLLELAETPIVDSLASFSFPEIELEDEYDHDPQLDDSVLFPDSIMTPVSPPDFTFPESTLDPIPIHNEIESPILDDHIELDLDSHNLFTSETDCTILTEDVDLSFEELYGDELEFLNIGSKEISPILGHIPLWEEDCGLEFQILDLDSILEPSPTPEPLLDFVHTHTHTQIYIYIYIYI